MNKTPYDRAFYDRNRTGSVAAAGRIVPIVMELVHPESVIDFGCGTGTWLRVFREFEVGQILGFDGSYVDPKLLLIPRDRFTAVDLTDPTSLPSPLRADLAMCLEVVEHLPDRAGRLMVRTLTRASEVVLFSAAIPGQGGTRHINERWPEYWRALFEAEGFVLLDAIRPRVLLDESIDWWYRQNIVLYASPTALASNPALRLYQSCRNSLPFEWVHRNAVRNTVYASVRYATAQAVRKLLSRIRVMS